MIEIYNNIEVVAVECAYNTSCEFCLFDDDKDSCDVAKCLPGSRNDRKNVYFIDPVSVKPRISKERIVELALKNGFKLKPQPDGIDALNPYVFDFVADIVKELE